MKRLLLTVERDGHRTVFETPPGFLIKLPSPRVLDVSMSSGTAVTVAVSDLVAVELRED